MVVSHTASGTRRRRRRTWRRLPRDLAKDAGTARCLGALLRQPDISIAMRSSLIRVRSYSLKNGKKKKKLKCY